MKSKSKRKASCPGKHVLSEILWTDSFQMMHGPFLVISAQCAWHVDDNMCQYVQMSTIWHWGFCSSSSFCNAIKSWMHKIVTKHKIVTTLSDRNSLGKGIAQAPAWKNKANCINDNSSSRSSRLKILVIFADITNRAGVIVLNQLRLFFFPQWPYVVVRSIFRPPNWQLWLQHARFIVLGWPLK